ncbi:hypothetical protein GCM10007939_06170 [Amylibacter marinus]|uniref:Winged helix-turn-helix domain-containing protein n=1 Tax=Amylibacter marinus TaxID=1475483 RepID=A0ABQ5VT28_9RHOB|nr:crosslink repair DNA glycosylase YcaQ family protein [Amylibacter marinus]GLQ34334.1 hypothetical protein GCM10007939_06170 [Amylibacter marinus]
MAFKITNSQARALWLSTNGLGAAPTGPLDVAKMIRNLGFVQLDTIQVVSRAHHHILWSRNQNYREAMFDPLYREQRAIFEHFTHDASVIPMDFLPMWQRQFNRKRIQIEGYSSFKKRPDTEGRADIKARIAAEGALSTHAFSSKIEGEKKMWARPPHKQALDYMWYAGELATCYRENFTKYYNLAERVFPKHLREIELSDSEQIDWLCRAALDRLSFANTGEIQRFWDAMSAIEARAWAKTASFTPVQVQGADGTWLDALGTPDIEARIAALPAPSTRLRIINPFDPATRDRKRLERLFGFEYRIEMFVPAAKRRWGYYVYPLLEGNRFVGRIEVKAERAKDHMIVLNLWREAGIKWSTPRANRLEAELARFARLAGVSKIKWACDSTPKV